MRYEQRHFNRLTERWSDWYPSSAAAYREHCIASVPFYQVRPAQPAPEDRT